jgi:uncharacterized protein (DUF1501 family)
MITTRRTFLKGCSTAIAAMAGARLGPLAFASGPGSDSGEVLVVVFLRGGMDGLSLLPPIAGADRGYYEDARPQLKLATTGAQAAIPLDGRFGLHPAARGLADLYGMGNLAIVQAVGTSGSRSHFDAMRSIELGTPGSKALGSGWLTRHLETTPSLAKTILMPALAVAGSTPTSLLGSTESVNMSNPNQFSLSSIGHWSWATGDQRTTLRRLYARGITPLHSAGIQALNATGIVESVAGSAYKPAAGVTYPGGGFSDQLKLIAQMIKLEVGLRVATIDLGGWDTHESQANTFTNLVTSLSAGLAAFYADLDRSSSPPLTKRLTIVVQSEFGRRIQENAQRGTDHGTANPMLVIGGNVHGGIYGTWPGLHPDQRFEGADLAPTNDYRTILSEILIRRFGNPKIGDVFPGFSSYKPLGLVAGSDTPIVYVTEKPPAPGSFKIRRATEDAVRLEWSAAENATSYKVEKLANSATDWTEIAALTSASTQFDDPSPDTGKGSYRVKAINSGGESDYTPAITLEERPLTPLDKWRFQYFASTDSTDAAADEFVPTSDGLNNFTKYALGLVPSFAASVTNGFSPGLPKTELNDDQFSLVYTHPVDRTDVRFEVHYSDDFKTWTPVTPVSEGIKDGMERHRASVPAAGNRQFMRLKTLRV